MKSYEGYNVSLRMFWFSILLLLSSQALAQEGFVQLRFFYPYQGTEFTSGFALDAALKYRFDGNNLTFAVKNSSIFRQTVGLELAGDWGLASADFTGEAGAEVGARRIGITALGVWILPRSEGITPLETVTLVLVHDTDDSIGTSFYVVDVATLLLNGQIAQDWRWTAGYSLASTVTTTTAIRHNINVGLRGRLGAFTLGLGTTLTQDKNIWIYGGNFDLAWQVSATENISARATLTSRPLDTQSLTFSTTAFQPVTIALSVGRSSLGGLTAGASLDANLEAGWSVNATYAGAFGDTASHDFGGSLAYANSNARIGIGANWNTLRNAGLWTSRFALSANGAYQVDNLSFSLRGAYSFDTTPNNINPQPNSGNASANLSWRNAPLEVIFETSFQFRGTVSGTAQLQVLYDITPQLAVNGSLLFTRVLTAGGQNGFSFGAGLRYRF